MGDWGMDTTAIPGLLLAGGRSRRMGLAEGADKCLARLGESTLLDRVVERAAPQVKRLVLSANGDPDRFVSFGMPVIADSLGVGFGPLAGVLTGLEWTANEMPEAEYMASFATDTPFFPDDLVAKLAREIERGADLACARSLDVWSGDPVGSGDASPSAPSFRDALSPVGTAGASSRLGEVGRLQPLFALWPVALRYDLRRALVDEGLRRVDLCMARHRLAVVEFPADGAGSFFNINKPSDLEDAERLLREAGSF